MSASNPSSGRIAAENELLAQLGLPPSASPEDVDQLHLAVSQFLAAAPPSVRGWAHAQAAALDEAYLTLTDPVGLEGSALRSPTRPPTVVPGGPATPPARRGPTSAVETAVAAPAVEAAAPVAVVEADEPGLEPTVTPTDGDATDMAAVTVDDTDTDDLDALYASVTPGAHRDLVSGGKADRKPQPLATAQPVAQPARPAAAAPAAAAGARRHTRSTRPRPAAQVVAPAPASAGPWKWVAIFASIALAVLVVGFVVVPFVFNLGGGGAPGSSDAAAHASPTAPAVDQAKVSALMAKLQANPNDTASLQALGDEFFAGQEYSQAATFYDQLLALEPNNIAALLARGATYYNLGDSINSEKLWKQVVALNPTDKGQAQEVHYDLGFLYLNSATPNWDGVQSEWNQVIAIDATTQLAKTVQQHLDSLASASMIPAASGATPSGSAAPSGSAVPSVAASPSSSLAAGASPASTPVSEGALNGAFTSGTLNAPANTPFTIHFNNQDSGVPNDMLIKDSAGNTVFKGDMVTGPAAVDYAVPALAPGTYTFVSTIHPTTMNGTLVVGS